MHSFITEATKNFMHATVWCLPQEAAFNDVFPAYVDYCDTKEECVDAYIANLEESPDDEEIRLNNVMTLSAFCEGMSEVNLMHFDCKKAVEASATLILALCEDDLVTDAHVAEATNEDGHTKFDIALANLNRAGESEVLLEVEGIQVLLDNYIRAANI